MPLPWPFSHLAALSFADAQPGLFDPPSWTFDPPPGADVLGGGGAPGFLLPLPAASAGAPAGAPAGVLANAVGDGGARALGADLARAGFGVTGAGVRIGILSDSFDVRGGYAADQATGALPAGVTVLQEGPAGASDEGRAMAQLVHQVAPGAQIYFYSAFRGEANFADGIRALADAGCNVIVDDVTYLDEPFFQDGAPIQKAVADVVARGVSYFTSASNQGTNFYQHGFVPMTAALPGLKGSYRVMNFGTAAAPQSMQGLTVAKGATITIDLQWDQPFASVGVAAGGAANSLGLLLYDTAGRIVASALVNRTGSDPVQILRFCNTTGGTDFRLAIVANGGSAPPNLLKYIVYGQGVAINDPNAGRGSGTVIGHETAKGANSVGAIAAYEAPTLGGGGRVEAFSSVGPGAQLFDAQGRRLTDSMSTAKVDFVAPDGIATSVFPAFYGTSAAAPNAAAVAALMLQANPALTPAQLTAILAKSAIAVTGPAGGTGTGLIQAAAAVRLAIDLRKAAPAVPARDVVRSGAGTTTAWTTAPTAPVQQAIAAVAADPAALGDFTVSIDPAALAPTWQPATAGASYALLHNAFAEVAEILPAWHPGAVA